MDKEQMAIERLKAALEMFLAVSGLPPVVTTSRGKDSSVCVALAERAGIPFEVMHNYSTADAPETVYFIWEDFRRLELKGVKCIVNYPVYTEPDNSPAQTRGESRHSRPFRLLQLRNR